MQNAWEGDTSSVVIQGLKEGTACLTLTLFDLETGTTLDTKVVSITVTSKNPNTSNNGWQKFVDVLSKTFGVFVEFATFFSKLIIWLIGILSK